MTIQTKIEALLFVADAPVRVSELAHACECTEEVAQAELDALQLNFCANRGIHLIRIAGGYQFCTHPDLAEMIAKFLKPQNQKVTRALLEVLAVVAYRQPVTAAEVESIRGVQSDYGLRVLAERRLIREVGRKQTPGRPMLYGTTDQFLHHFGLDSLGALPTIAPQAIPAIGGEA